MDKTIGFIGGGNMASAMIKGILEKGLLDREHLIVSHRTEEGCQRSREKFGIEATQDNMRVVEVSQCIVLAVKPQYYQQVIRQIRDNISAGHLIISIAPGKTLGWLEQHFGKPVKLVRTMPNTPAMVREGMTAVCPNDCVSKEELDYVVEELKKTIQRLRSMSPLYEDYLKSAGRHKGIL